MGKYHKDQKGFTIVELLLVIIALGIFGFVGYYVYSQHKSANKSVSVSASTTKQASQNQVFKIPELGVQLTIPDTLQGLTYSYVPADAQSGTPPMVNFSTKALTDGTR